MLVPDPPLLQAKEDPGGKLGTERVELVDEPWQIEGGTTVITGGLRMVKFAELFTIELLQTSINVFPVTVYVPLTVPPE